MKIRSPLTRLQFNRIYKLFSNRKFLVVALFLGYNIMLGVMGFSVVFREVSHALRSRIILKIEHFKSELNPFARFSKPDESLHKQIHLVVDSLHLKSISCEIDDDFKYTTFGTDPIEVPAILSCKQSPYQVIIRNQSQFPRKHESRQACWPLYVDFVDEDHVFAYHNFSIHLPESSVLDEWLVQKIFKAMNLTGLNIEFIQMRLNDGDLRPYLIKEEMSEKFKKDHFASASIVNFWDAQWKSFHQRDPDSELTGESTIALKAGGILNQFLLGKLPPEVVFDIPKLATFMALSDLFGMNQPTHLDKAQFYYDPEKSLFYPISFDYIKIGNLKEHGLLGAERSINLMSDDPTAGARFQWYDVLLRDRTFFSAYISALEEISLGQFLEDKENEAQFAEIKRMIQSDYSDVKINTWNQLHANLHYIRRTLRPAKILQVHYSPNKSQNKEHYFEISNIHNLPVEVLDCNVGDSIKLHIESIPEVIQPNIQKSPVNIQGLVLTEPHGDTLSPAQLAGINILAKILGSGRILSESVIPYATYNSELLEGDLVRQTPNFRQFKFLKIDDERRIVKIDQGNHELDRSLILPAGFLVLADGGTSLNMTNHANILSYSPVRLCGELDNPVEFYSTDSTAQGITILNTNEESILRNVHFENLSHPQQSGWVLTSGLTFYESPVSIQHCLFRSNRKADDYLNIVRSKYVIDSCVFLNSFADAFDADFSDGVVRNTRFINSGNDAIDVSGGHLAMTDILIEGCGDKGISAGEKTNISVGNLFIKDAEIAVTSKDLSIVTIDDIEIIDSRIAYAVFQKKSEYGPGQINVKNSSKISGSIEIPFLIEDRSLLTISGEKMSANSGVPVDHVRQILYGVKFGKSSN